MLLQCRDILQGKEDKHRDLLRGTVQAEIKKAGFTFRNLSIFFTTPPFTTSSTAEGEADRTRLSTPVAL